VNVTEVAAAAGVSVRTLHHGKPATAAWFESHCRRSSYDKQDWLPDEQLASGPAPYVHDAMPANAAHR